jgi:hypothetical protein
MGVGDSQCVRCRNQSYILVDRQIDGRNRQIALCSECFLSEADPKSEGLREAASSAPPANEPSSDETKLRQHEATLAVHR